MDCPGSPGVSPPVLPSDLRGSRGITMLILDHRGWLRGAVFPGGPLKSGGKYRGVGGELRWITGQDLITQSHTVGDVVTLSDDDATLARVLGIAMGTTPEVAVHKALLLLGKSLPEMPLDPEPTEVDLVDAVLREYGGFKTVTLREIAVLVGAIDADAQDIQADLIRFSEVVHRQTGLRTSQPRDSRHNNSRPRGYLIEDFRAIQRARMP